MRVSQSRSGRRPISVSKLLKKEKDGTLYKFDAHVKENDEEKKAGGCVLPDGSGFFVGTVGKKDHPKSEEKKTAERFAKAASSIGLPSVSYLDADTDVARSAKRPKRKGDIPSREDVQTRGALDGRENATVIPGTGTQLTEVGATCTPGGERNV